jgi:DNA mismatch repair protein MutS
MIYDDYIAYSETYQQKYGDKTVVLMEVGSFFELYAVQNKDETSGADIATICDLCNIQLSRKNKSILENNRQNPLMAGFPSFALNKHTDMLLAAGYTVVLIKQVTAPPNPRREVTEILSPGLQVSPQGVDSSWLLVSYWDAGNASGGSRTRQLCVGFCGIDVSTGQTWMYEVGNTDDSFNELIKCMHMYQAREIIFIGSSSLTEAEKSMILEHAGSHNNYHALWEAIDTKYTQVTYQNAMLQKSYGSFDMLSPIEALDMERMYNVRVAFTFMLQFAYEHNTTIIQHLKKPTLVTYDKRCNLEHTSAVQLQLIGTGGGGGAERPLVSLLARCATAFGTRAFKYRLLSPTYDHEELQQRYDQIETYMKNVDVLAVHAELRGVLDLERLTRRMVLGTFHPTDWMSLHTSLERILNAANKAGRQDIIDLTHSLMQGYTILNLGECSKYLLGDIRSNIFCEGVYEEVDSAARDLAQVWTEFEKLVSQCNCTIAGACKIEFNDRDGYFIQVTKKRWDTIRTDLPACIELFDGIILNKKEFEAKPMSSSSTIVRVTHPWIHTQSDNILKLTRILSALVTQKYKEFLQEYSIANEKLLDTYIKQVGELDILTTCARNALEYRYTKPRLQTQHTQHTQHTKNGAGAGFEARGIRHPIIERIHTQTVYTPNDVCLGGGCEHGHGHGSMLLFGVNSSGKSSLMKAIGLNVIMAQAGMYVAADDFLLTPFTSVFTRIVGMDDIYRGWSTFTVEMMELRNILLKANSSSLILGDELCSGTESLSATAIVAAGIQTLAERGAAFVFATHLHDLAKIVTASGIKLYHMHVETHDGVIRFDRKLREGVGSGVYGLEVCAGLNLPPDFMKRAHGIRCELEGRTPELVASTKSRYNAKIFMDTCSLCGSSPSETHHVAPQAGADENGFIDHFHKNSAFNLIAVCERCHDMIHAGKIHVNGFISTSEGIRLQSTSPPPLTPHALAPTPLTSQPAPKSRLVKRKDSIPA